MKTFQSLLDQQHKLASSRCKSLYLSIAILSLATMVHVSTVQAQDFDGDNDIKVDTDNDFDIRPYVGLGIGTIGLERSDANINKNVFGGYGKLGIDIGDYLGAELRLGSSGSANSTINGIPEKMKASYLSSYLAKLQYPVTPDFKAYMLLGATTGRLKTTNLNNNISQNKTKTGLSYGVGVEYYLQDNLSVGGEWMQYWSNVKLGNNFGSNAKAKIWGAVATINYHFF